MPETKSIFIVAIFGSDEYFNRNRMSDEEAIPYEYKCRNGNHINKAHLCDGVDDCGDYSDEQKCGSFISKLYNCCI